MSDDTLIGTRKFIPAEESENIKKYNTAIETYKKLIIKLNEISKNMANETILTDIESLITLLNEENTPIINNKIVGQYDNFIHKELESKITTALGYFVKSDKKTLTVRLTR